MASTQLGAGTVTLTGASSGSATLQSTDATTTTITLPSVTSTLYGNAGTTITSGTAQASTSGTSIDFTGIPSWAKRVTVIFNAVSTAGSLPQLQVGSTSYVTTGYAAQSVYIASINTYGIGTILTTGIPVSTYASATDTVSGTITLTNISGNIWVATGVTYRSGTYQLTETISSASITLSGALDRIRVTTVNGTDAFDAGSINIFYE